MHLEGKMSVYQLTRGIIISLFLLIFFRVLEYPMS